MCVSNCIDIQRGLQGRRWCEETSVASSVGFILWAKNEIIEHNSVEICKDGCNCNLQSKASRLQIAATAAAFRTMLTRSSRLFPEVTCFYFSK